MIDWTTILMDVGIRLPLHANENSICCPFHEDNVASCSINTDKGVWICFAGCGQGSLHQFLMKYLHISYDEVTALVQSNEANFSVDIFDDVVEEEAAMIEIASPFQHGYVPDWIFQRGFTKQTLKQWDCGIDMFNSLVIPIHNAAGIMVGWVLRKQQGTPKYLYSKGLRKSKLLFGQHLILDEVPFVCITEGSLDTMWLYQQGFPSVAILGATISRRQVDLASTLPTQELVLCLDNDEPGRIGLNKAMACLSQNFMVSYIKMPEEFKDVQDIRDSEMLQSIIKERTFL